MDLQIATTLKQEFAAANLQLIEEYIFNTEGSPKEAVESLKVGKYLHT